MPIVYVPRLIESAEQAGALPIGTIAVSHNVAGAAVKTCIRVDDGWFCTEEIGFDGVQDVIGHKYMVGDRALVPIEAEEEHVAPDAITYSRYVAAWEEA